LAPLSGVEAISPAFEETKRQLFRPFCWGRWTRLAVVSFLTGELSGGGLSPPNFNFPLGGGKRKDELAWVWLSQILGDRFWEFLPLIIAGALALLLIFVFLIYVSSVFRFILFDSVLHNRCEVRAGWRNYKGPGGSYFLWQICFGIATLAAFALVILLPLISPWGREALGHPREHLVMIVLGVILMILAVLCVAVLSGLASLFARDFVVPFMAIEGVGVVEGWRRLFLSLNGQKGAVAIYVLMKMVLAVGVGIAFALIDIAVLIVLLIPILLIGAVAFFWGQAAGLTWNPVTIAISVLAGGVMVAALLFVMAMLSVPVAVFFQSYALYFLGSRYPQLGEQMSFTAKVSPAPGTLPPASAPLPAS
jgi:hypothetical protein